MNQNRIHTGRAGRETSELEVQMDLKFTVAV